MADVNYVSPESLATIGNMNGAQNPNNPNIGPVQGFMQGTAFARTRDQLDLSRQSQLMDLARKKQENLEFMQQSPYRNQAAISGFQNQDVTSRLGETKSRYELGRLPDENTITTLKQHADIKKGYQELSQPERDWGTGVWPTVQATLDENGNTTQKTAELWPILVQDHDTRFPQSKIAGTQHAQPSSNSLTALKLTHSMTVNTPEYQQKSGLIGQEYGYKGAMQKTQITADKELQAAKLTVEKEISVAELANRLGIARLAHKKEQLISDAIEAKGAWEAAGGDEKAYKKLSPREKALVDPDTFHRLLPTWTPTADEQGRISFLKAKGAISGTMAGLPGAENTPEPTKPMQALEPPPEAKPQSQSQTPVGTIKQFKQGHFRYLGGPEDDPKSWQRVR